MTDPLDENSFYQMVSVVYHLSLLIYDKDGSLQKVISPDPEGVKFLSKVTQCAERLLQLCSLTQKPKVISSELNQVWAGIPLIEGGEVSRLLVVGPVYTSEVSENLVIEYARANHLSTQSREKLIQIFKQTMIYPYIEFTRLLSMIFYFHYHEEMDISLLATAALPKDMIEFKTEEKALKKSQVYNETYIHATYTFEQYIWECIREGKLEKLKRHLLKSGTYGNIGPIGNNDPVRQQKNIFICAVTLATRAAIEGGLSPETAYSLSDLYIQQVETMRDVLPIMTLSENMLYDLTTRVNSKKHTRRYSKIVNDCCNFIDEHARENLRISQVAEFTGLSADYVSKKFKEETGSSIGDTIRDAKISEAKSLLKYSDLSLADISELLSFSSQSFFTSTFKQVAGITPKQFRENAEEI